MPRKTPAVPPAVVPSLDAVIFRNDHCDPNDADKKLIRPSPGNMADASATFTKPEWDAATGPRAPASYTMGTNVVVDLQLQLTMTPPTRKAQLSKIRGTSSEGAAFTFERKIDPPDVIIQGEKLIYWVQASAPLATSVDRLQPRIDWFVTVDGSEISLGPSEHIVYVTFARPHGKMENVPGDFPTLTGAEQDVTEERLKLAIDFASGAATEKDVVDKVFKRLSSFQRYANTVRWPKSAPGTTFQQYQWQLLDDTAKGECQLLAAAFILGCQIVGVGSMELGRMFPAGRRDPKTGQPRASPKRGFYERPETRIHTVKHVFADNEHHGDEVLGFRDGSGDFNYFEGVAKYSDRFLYGIGEDVPQTGSTADENAHLWYETANFKLEFRRDNPPQTPCDHPYDTVTNTTFLWTD